MVHREVKVQLLLRLLVPYFLRESVTTEEQQEEKERQERRWSDE